MLRCRAVQANLTAWIDREVPGMGSHWIRRHLHTCASCRAEAESLRRAIERQQRLLHAAVAAEGFVAEPLQAWLQRALAAEPVRRAPVWDWPWDWLVRPIAVAGTVLALACALLLYWTGGPDEVLIPLGVESPPVAVTRQPELFKDYPLIERLDALEYFDTVQSVPLDDDRLPQRG